MERTNALHVKLSELVDLVTIDVGWTPQRLILPHAKTLLKPGGQIISLIKPHYEAKNAHLPIDKSLSIAEKVKNEICDLGFVVCDFAPSPILGEKGGNTEFLINLKMLY
jgi:Predicted rRNA methylase